MARDPLNRPSRVLLAVGLVLPVTVSLTVFPTWFEAWTYLGRLETRETGFESAYGQVVLTCSALYVLASLILRRYIAILAIVLSIGVAAALVAALVRYDNQSFVFAEGETSAAFAGACALGVGWFVQAVLVVVLWPEARRSARGELTAVGSDGRAILEALRGAIRGAAPSAPRTPTHETPATTVSSSASGLPRLPQITWLGIAAAAAMLIGSFGPWIKVIGLVNTSISGTDGSNDGWFVAGAAVVGAGGLVWHARGWRPAAAGALLAGVVGTYATYHDRQNVTKLASEVESNLASAQVGWGLNVALGASIFLGIIGAIALLGNQEAPGMRVAVAAPASDDHLSSTASQLNPDAPPSFSIAAEVERLADLHTRGILSDEEYQAAKARLLRANDRVGDQ